MDAENYFFILLFYFRRYSYFIVSTVVTFLKVSFPIAKVKIQLHLQYFETLYENFGHLSQPKTDKIFLEIYEKIGLYLLFLILRFCSKKSKK